jgi:TPR repeat protein
MNTKVTGANLQASLKAVQDGDARAQGAIGLAYLEGTVTVHDCDRALKWSTLAANQRLQKARQ